MLIGISGKHDSGKGTVCKIIQAVSSFYTEYGTLDTNEVYEYVKSRIRGTFYTNCRLINGWEIVYFADRLKHVISTLTGCKPSILYTHEGKESRSPIAKPWTDGFYTYRELLQLFGSNIGRIISPNIWIDILFSSYTDDKKWLVEDIRFPNELESVRSRGGLILRCERIGLPYDPHPSETALDTYTDKFDEFILFDSNLDGMITRVIEIFNKYNLK